MGLGWDKSGMGWTGSRWEGIRMGGVDGVESDEVRLGRMRCGAG